jgi:hypothetical protein
MLLHLSAAVAVSIFAIDSLGLGGHDRHAGEDGADQDRYR